MPARKRPTREDTVTARQTLLDGLARDVDILRHPGVTGIRQLLVTFVGPGRSGSSPGSTSTMARAARGDER